MKRVFDAALKLYYPPDSAARGCFLIGTAATEAVVDNDGRALLGSAPRGFDTIFEARFRQARASGELDADADPVALSRIASALRSRAGDKRAELAATAAGIVLICGPQR